MPKAYLVLENGIVFEGDRFGAGADCAAQLVFNTGMIGYTQSLTDPAYSGQILIDTFPQTGGYGVCPDDFLAEQGGPAGYVVRSYCKTPSNFRSSMTLDGLLKLRGIPAICNIDTRKLTKIVRNTGYIRAAIADSVEKADKLLKEAPLTPLCGVRQQQDIILNKQNKMHVAVLDYGVTNTIINQLKSRKLNITLLPKDITANEILNSGYDGVVISPGPSDPADYKIDQLSLLIGKTPLFGIGLGHQLLALAMGGKTAQLSHGHRGLNIVVKDLDGGQIRLTNQNHGYIVLEGSLPNSAHINYENLDDGSIEGIDYTDVLALSVQFEPGDIDYDRFVLRMEGKR